MGRTVMLSKTRNASCQSPLLPDTCSSDEESSSLFRLVYSSKASNPLTCSNLLDLGKHCSEPNISSFLLHCPPRIWQCIEGPETVIDNVERNLRNDTLHHDMVTAQKTRMRRRLFTGRQVQLLTDEEISALLNTVLANSERE